MYNDILSWIYKKIKRTNKKLIRKWWKKKSLVRSSKKFCYHHHESIIVIYVKDFNALLSIFSSRSMIVKSITFKHYLYLIRWIIYHKLESFRILKSSFANQEIVVKKESLLQSYAIEHFWKIFTRYHDLE